MSDTSGFVQPAPMEGKGAYNRSSRVQANAFAKQAAEDWQEFLSMRSRELCPGGRLVVLTMATDDAGDFGYRPLLDAIYATLNDTVDEGLLRAEELRRMAIPTVARSRAQFADPFAKSGRFADLTIERLEIFYGEDRIWAQYETNGECSSVRRAMGRLLACVRVPNSGSPLGRGRG